MSKSNWEDYNGDGQANVYGRNGNTLYYTKYDLDNALNCIRVQLQKVYSQQSELEAYTSLQNSSDEVEHMTMLGDVRNTIAILKLLEFFVMREYSLLEHNASKTNNRYVDDERERFISNLYSHRFQLEEFLTQYYALKPKLEKL